METIDRAGRKGLIVGIANEHSLAWSAAEHFHKADGDPAITYLGENAKLVAEPLARQTSITAPRRCKRRNAAR